MKVVIAPNAFKNSLPADEVAAAIRQGLLQGGYKGDCVCHPVGDGGDGTGALLNHCLGAEVIAATVADPLGRSITASFGWIAATKTAVIELADASGLRLLDPKEYDPLRATTAGCGQLIKAALDRGAAEILFCIGGSATVDGGSGLLKELGVVFLNEKKEPLQQLPADLVSLRGIDRQHSDPRLNATTFTILCDVKNHLLGAKGAAAVFGPQKGAGPDEVRLLESGLKQLRRITERVTGTDINQLTYSGAAGGVAATCMAFFNAKAVNGIDYFLSRTGFEALLKDAGWVITGEGAIDHQTLEGKAPYGVARMAKRYGIPVIGVAGKVPEEEDTALNEYFDWLLPINEQPLPLEEAIRLTRTNLEKTGRKIASTLNSQLDIP
ncbi:glycerate kinase [Niabella beijingensis]|uniref:glycerate kinase n=1 Tax=Niabella beijingensis TaxID=2872700 RepID=UPI001CBF4C46|nr:glycerate kinase [Niabella beijingensis]MBZ4190860.1 glycerate kinase [Niabella beijingensis]